MTISNAAKEALIEVLDSKDETLRAPDAPAQGPPQTAVAPAEVDQLTSVEREWLIAMKRSGDARTLLSHEIPRSM